MKSLVIASNCSGGGKTTFTLGLMESLKNMGYKIQGFKVGPDYIDTGFHREITGQDSRNLDLHLMGEEGVKTSFSRGSGDLAIIEGVMGLYDGKGNTDYGSTYNISKILGNAPILLVITPRAQSITLCAELKGLKEFRDGNIIGVVLNNTTESYYKLLKEAIEKNCKLKVFGYVPKSEEIKLGSRHLGLVQSIEISNLKEKISICEKLISKHIDLESILSEFKYIPKLKDKFHIEGRNKKIAVAYDESFSFYYKENLELLSELGELVYFSPLRDGELPKDIDFLYIGGGYPEVYKSQLSKNKTMLESIRKSLENGLNCYAECGGLMYLTEEIEGKPMVGFFNGKSYMTERLNRFGYSTLEIDNIEINCHEFHKSIVKLKEEPVYRVWKNGYNGEIKEWKCGYIKKNTVGAYPHVHFFGNLKFIKFLLTKKEGV